MSYLRFKTEDLSASGITKRISVKNTGNYLVGTISWHAAWRRYTFTSEPYFVLDHECLREIANFLEKETREHKERRA